VVGVSGFAIIGEVDFVHRRSRFRGGGRGGETRELAYERVHVGHEVYSRRGEGRWVRREFADDVWLGVLHDAVRAIRHAHDVRLRHENGRRLLSWWTGRGLRRVRVEARLDNEERIVWLSYTPRRLLSPWHVEFTDFGGTVDIAIPAADEVDRR
jgi:hypothetical protein